MNNRFVNDKILIVIVIILSYFINSFIFILPFINYSGQKYTYNSFINNLNVDFDIPSPSKDQINELRKLDFVEKVIPYYYDKIDINSKRSDAILFDNIDDLQFIFKNYTFIKGYYSNENSIYADYILSKNLNLKFNDNISINNKNYILSGIYKENVYYNKGILFLLNTDYTLYSGAYIKSKDKNKLEEYLKHYIPLGRLKDESNFKTQESYNIHSNAIYSGNYLSEITYIPDRINSDINTINSKFISYFSRFILGIVLTFIIMILLNNALFNKHKNYIYDILIKGADIKDIILSYKYSLIISLLVSFIVYIICYTILYNVVSYYMPKIFIFSLLLIYLIIYIISIIISFKLNNKNIMKILENVKIKLDDEKNKFKYKENNSQKL